jgi:hypothetical protein
VSGQDRTKFPSGQRLRQMKQLRLVLGSNGKTSLTSMKRSATSSMMMQKDRTNQQRTATMCREVNCHANSGFHLSCSDLSLAGLS